MWIYHHNDYLSTHTQKNACLLSFLHTYHQIRKIPWRREWQPTPVFLPGEFHRQRSLTGYSPWSHKELDTSGQLTHTSSPNRPQHSADSKILRAFRLYRLFWGSLTGSTWTGCPQLESPFTLILGILFISVLFFHSFNKYIMKAHCMPGIVWGSRIQQ